MRRDIFQAIADPTRRAIVMLLAVQAMTPNAMAEHFETSRQAVSKHIRILVECELVDQEQLGREIQYSLRAGKMREMEKWLEQFKAVMAKRFSQLDDVLTQLKARKK
ncbi:MAG: ArsR family transcriptional regulator [Fibrobacteres bacterium]|nr:ArsR family transcriptional regulator [Fibrobacterota bacterium]